MAHIRLVWLAALGLLSASSLDAAAAGQRFKQLTMEDLTPEQRAAAGLALTMASSGLRDPYNTMLRSPAMAERLLPLEDYLRSQTSLPHRLNEFAILIQARLWTSQTEWRSHYPLAVPAGLPEAVAADLRLGRRPEHMQPDEAAVYDFCMELATKHEVSDLTFAEVKAVLTDQQLVDLATVSGTYVTFAMILATGNAGTVDGSTPLPPLAPRWDGEPQPFVDAREADEHFAR